MALLRNELARYIDAALLDPSATAIQVEAFCIEAAQRACAGVCVLPIRIELAARLLAGKHCRVIGVMGFPLGGDLTETKVLAARRAIEQGATELDLVWNLGRFLDNDQPAVLNDLEAVIDGAGQTAESLGRPRPVVKVILECSALDEKQMVAGAQLAAKAGAHFVKTGTGMGPKAAPATVDQVRLLREALPFSVSVKAAGGIQSPEKAEALLKAGADRLGVSSLTAVLGPIVQDPAIRTKR